MITHIEVDGFKSLDSFQMSFYPGLNILVGPNGSGKTNIVSFFEFLADLMDTDASEATSRVGGAGAVFRRVKESYEKRIQARIIGCVLSPHEVRRAHKTEPLAVTSPYCLYNYSFSLLFPESRDTVVFEKQRLQLTRTDRFLLYEEIEEAEIQWGVDIEAELGMEGPPAAKINAYDPEILDLPYHPARGKGKEPRPEFEQTIASLLAANISLVAVVSRYTPDMWALGADITGGQIYNIVPSRVKMPEDSAKPPGIARDGSGLAATLYALQRSKHPEDFGHWFLYQRPRQQQFGPSALDQLKSYLRLVNTSIDQFDVLNDPLDNQLRVRYQIHSGDYYATVPMSLMSDGTLKWIALVTAALTARSVFSIEEPENYLHPQMQAQIVNILREILFKERSERFTLMTTHSETLLNHCRPEELIIVSMSDGKTVAKRCENPSDISDEISRTGFGLGYYYITNALENE